jgi:hypothetical protein
VSISSQGKIVIFTETRLRNVLKSYIDYYNKYRPHQGLHGIPNAPPVQPETGEIRKKPLVFGLHNHYYICEMVRSKRLVFGWF